MSPQNWLVDPLWLSLAMALVHFVWQGTLLATVYAFAVRYIARGAEQRYLVGVATMLAMAVCVPVTIAMVEPPALPFPQLETNAGPIDATSAVAFGAAAADAALPGDESGHAVSVGESRLARLLPWITAVWIAGVSMFSLRLVTGVAALRWLASRGVAPSVEILSAYERLARSLRMSRPPRLVVARHVRQALAVGFFRPVILLPAAWLSELPPNVVEAVLAHELAHIRRYDLWVNLVQRVIEALLFFHPAVWWISKQIRADREMCCDELAVGVTEQRLAYASALEVVALRTVREPAFSLATGIGGRKMQLLNRVRNVLGLPPTSPAGAWWPAGVLALAAPCLVWLMAANGPQQAHADEDDAIEVEVVLDDEARDRVDDARDGDDDARDRDDDARDGDDDAREDDNEDDRAEEKGDGAGLLRRLAILGRLFADDLDINEEEEIVTELVIRDDEDDDDDEEADGDDERPARKQRALFGLILRGDEAEAQRDRAEAEVAKTKRAMLKLTAAEDEEYAQVRKRLAEAKQQLVEELDRAHKLGDEKVAAEAEARVQKLRQSLDQKAADMKLQYAKRQQADLDKLKAKGYAPCGDDVHDYARRVHERIAEVHKATDLQRKKLHQDIAEAAKSQQHDVVQKLHKQMEKLNAESVAVQQKLHTALGEKIKTQHADRLGDYERQIAEHQQRFAAEREKLEAHRAQLEQQRRHIEEQHRQVIDKFNKLRVDAKLEANPKVELEFQNTEKLANPKNVELEFQIDKKLANPKNVEIEFQKTEKLANPKNVELEFKIDKKLAQPKNVEIEFQNVDKLANPKYKADVDEGNRQELLDIVRELRKELQDLRREVRELRGERGDKSESRLDLKWPEGAPKPKLPRELDVRKRKLAGVGEDREFGIEIQAQRAAQDAALAGEKAAKFAATAAENFAKEATVAAEKVAKEATVAAEQVAKQAAVAAEQAVKEAAATAEKAAKQAAEAVEKATEKSEKKDEKEATKP